MPADALLADALANAFVAGEIEPEGLVDRGSALLGRRWRWLSGVARRICLELDDRPRPRCDAVARFLLADHGFRRACEIHKLRWQHLTPSQPIMAPIAAAMGWRVPPIQTPGELADWLKISIGELDWFADRRGWEAKCRDVRLQHYHYRVLSKRFGQVRLIEAPKPRLKEIQRRILSEILYRVPTHEAVHGFRPGHSISTFAAQHVGKQIVLRIDLADFFPSLRVARIEGIFRTLGYPDQVARLLAGLCTNCAPQALWTEHAESNSLTALRECKDLYAQPHLPQGAPTSPTLANLCAFRLDCRLAGLAAAAQATYTRYADDLAFSGDDAFARGAKRFQLHVCATAMEEGFAVRHRKTRIMRKAVSQQLAGIVVNQKLNVRRQEYDQLKATLTNCLRHGPHTQNVDGHPDFRAHLLGKISFTAAIHVDRGDRLRKLFEQIVW